MSHLDSTVLGSHELTDSTQAFSDCGVEVILDGVVSSAGQPIGYDCPFVAEFPMFFKQDIFLRLGPRFLDDVRI